MHTIDSELNLRQRHPDFQKFLDHNENESVRVRQTYASHIDQKYGTDPLQAMDIFPSNTANSPVLFFIHGGYWRALDKKSYSFVAEPFVRNNFTVCVVNYRLIPAVNMETLLNDVRDSILWFQQHASEFNANPHHIILSGHSAGGHLALMTHILNEGLRSDIRAICSISGIFDLAPIQTSYLNEILQLNDETVEEFSTSNKDLSVLKCPTLLSVGGGETGFFIEQSKSLHLSNKSSAPLEYHEYSALNHYEIVHKLGQQDSFLTRFIIENGTR